MDPSTKSTILFFIFTLALSSFLSISTSTDLAPSPSSSSTNDDSSNSPSPSSGDDMSPSSSAELSPTMSSSNDMSPSSSTYGGLGPADLSPSMSPPDNTADSSSYDTNGGAPSPSPDASYPSFPTMFSTKFERKMQERSMNNKATDLIMELCSGAENPGKCMEFFRESRTDDPAEIITTEIGTLKVLVQEGISAATKVRQQDGNIIVSGILDVCLENYDKAMANLVKASDTCAKCIRSNPKCSPKDTSEVRTMLSAAISNVGFCDEAFNAQGVTPPMKATNEAVIELTDWLLEFCKKLGKKY